MRILPLLVCACLFTPTSNASPPKEQLFSERYGLWFSFESTCSPCLKFAPVLYDFVTKHNVHIQAISKDAKPLRSWAGSWSKNEKAILYRLGIEEYPTPTLVLFDSQTKTTQLIGVGIMTEEQLRTRIYELTNIALGETP
ncbi:conjugal transfer protein TraF [Vibrio vulnificus]|uniref:conjugal transfer protein TraF n=1 Tax=Vibrio vulnificus TaxID=672 RepID=UPI001022B9AC|nr:hypothetical protein D8T38_18610 [Vibrio vulnificus]